MRAVAEQELAEFSRVTILDCVAEHTSLPQGSVDLVVAGSAFHWFDQAAALREAVRILRPGGWIVLVRMTRRVETPVEREYEDLLSRFSADHARLRSERLNLERGLVGCGFTRWLSVEERDTDFDELLGLTASYSIAPERGDPAFSHLEADLRQLFDRFAEGDRLRVGHELRVQSCRIDPLGDAPSPKAFDPAYWDRVVRQTR